MSSFVFDFDIPSGDNRNLEEIMHEANKSIEFDQFNDPEDNGPLDTSNDFFSKGSKKEGKKSEKKLESAKSREESREMQFQNSRNINEISMIGFEKNTSFQIEPQNNSPAVNDPRYDNLQRLLGRAKNNSLDHFYRNLDQQNTYPNEEKFRNKEEFKAYRSDLKAYKKSLEEDFQARNGNYNFRDNRYQMKQYAAPTNQYNFRKKEQSKEEDRDFFFYEEPKNAFLPAGMRDEEEDGDLPELGAEQVRRQVQRYEQQQYRKQAGEFFASDQFQKKKAEKPAKKLQIINEQRPNIFQNTQQQEKMGKILNNYQQLKVNYNGLMQRMKETNSDKVLILSELKKLKVECENRESRMKIQEESKREKQLAREREKEDQGRKLMAMREEIHRMKDNNEKDVLILKLNEKVESLEGILRNAINELTEEKQPKLIPKIINYYPDPVSARSHQTSYSGEEEQPNAQEPPRIDENYMGPVRNAIRELREQRKEEPSHFIDQFSSPLQLDLTVQDYPLNLSRGRSQQLEQPFVPPENSREFLPNGMDLNNKFLRRCLTQKSAVIFQSFQFYVTGKYSVTGNERYPVTCEVRVANKCAINLYDVFVIVYGPQAQEAELEVRPSKIMYDEFKYNTSFLFEVDLSRTCLEAGNFSVQLSYKTDKKKKVSFKATIPFAQLIKPEFIYQQQFITAWNHMDNELFVRPKPMDCRNIRSHQDLKLILPFTEINQSDPNCFSYGIMFTYPKSSTLFMVKVTCYVSGKASLHLKSSQPGQGADKRLREQILQILNYLIFG